MEGIITGIGDKELGKNLIKPEYDAVINNFIIGKNTILEGLELNGNNLSTGACILCGYRGIIEESKTLDTTAYVYGEFTINFDTKIEDSFNIVTSTTALTKNVNPSQITSAGTYYLSLYISGVEKIDREHSYPKNSQYSAETDYVGDNVVISSTATTPTETKTITNELGEEETVVATDLHNEYPNRVANTEYVHAQIDREIDYGTATANVMSKGKIVGTVTFYRKSKYVKGIIKSSGVATASTITLSFPQGFIPNENVKIAFATPKRYYSDDVTGIEYTHSIGTLNYTSGSVSATYTETAEFVRYSASPISFEASFGYQCQ